MIVGHQLKPVFKPRKKLTGLHEQMFKNLFQLAKLAKMRRGPFKPDYNAVWKSVALNNSQSTIDMHRNNNYHEISNLRNPYKPESEEVTYKQIVDNRGGSC